jgi:hypothetical protein
MKNSFCIALIIVFLNSCGPHRMGCGAKGICESPEKQILEKPAKRFPVKV